MIDDDNPEWTEADFKRARPAIEILPPDLLVGLVALKKQRGDRGPQKAPVKDRVTMRLSHEVVEQFKATGRGGRPALMLHLRNGWLCTKRKEAGVCAITNPPKPAMPLLSSRHSGHDWGSKRDDQ